MHGGAGADELAGGAAREIMYGGDGADLLKVDGGDDELDGGANNDVLRGDRGNDRLAGGEGEDLLQGGRGKDSLTGGAGVDTFAFAPLDSRPGGGVRDVIADFQRGMDRIDLSALDLSFGLITFKTIGSGLIVYGDLDGDGVGSQDFAVQLTGISALGAEDFMFG